MDPPGIVSWFGPVPRAGRSEPAAVPEDRDKTRWRGGGRLPVPAPSRAGPDRGTSLRILVPRSTSGTGRGSVPGRE
jgi:hypothetical protein